MQNSAAVQTADRFEDPYPAPESLRPWIAEIGRIHTLTDLPTHFTHVPQAVTTLVLRTEPSGRRDTLVIGPRTRATYAGAKAPAGCLRLRLAPGAVRPLFGVAAADLTDRILRLADMPGPAADLARELTELDLDDVIPFLESTLPQALSENATRREHRRLLDSAVAAIDGDATPLRDVATRLSVSERQLRNLFTTGVGVSPKHYARITRVRQVIDAAGNTPWSDIAVATGYYDQSHLTADFRSLMGVTPDRFFKGKLPEPTACQSVTALAR
ncbi:MAG: AraC family transcriptional regulator [Nocardia sp.]|uniref:helix-turn-helix domain-containing protein n=1 Tax=Nocardia sp. TaxID=1821 RepID=UPI0026079255|nr:AraC family transcriptional regulator [Nocardia sp.]MCU1644893.1 AraC family transcriptional regulator [Nocardia sp.]